MTAALLIEHNANIDVRDTSGRTPLHEAAALGSARLCELLLRHGADESLATFDGSTASQLAAAAPDSGASATLGDLTLRLAGIARKASTLYRSQQHGPAAETFERAIELAKSGGERVCSAADLATLHFNCARAAIKQGRHVFALAHVTDALEAKPQYANACMLQAECYMELLDFDAAAAAYRRVAALEPHNTSWDECATRASKLAAATAYDILGVADGAEPAEVKRAYHSQCLQWHPDKHTGSPEDQRRAKTMFQRVTAAYEVLSDELSRQQLDIRLRAEALRNLRMDHDAGLGGVHHDSAHGAADDFLFGVGGYPSGLDGVAYGAAEEMRVPPTSYGWRWTSRASPWFESDIEG